MNNEVRKAFKLLTGVNISSPKAPEMIERVENPIHKAYAVGLLEAYEATHRGRPEMQRILSSVQIIQTLTAELKQRDDLLLYIRQTLGDDNFRNIVNMAQDSNTKFL